MANENNLHPSSESDAMTAEPGAPAEALDILEDVLAGFTDALSADELSGARDFLLDVMAAHPLGHLLSERLRERTAAAQTEERDASQFGGAPAQDDGAQKVRGAG